MDEYLYVVLKKTGEGEDSWTWELHEADGDKLAEGNYMDTQVNAKKDFKKFERIFKNTEEFYFEKK